MTLLHTIYNYEVLYAIVPPAVSDATTNRMSRPRLVSCAAPCPMLCNAVWIGCRRLSLSANTT